MKRIFLFLLCMTAWTNSVLADVVNRVDLQLVKEWILIDYSRMLQMDAAMDSSQVVFHDDLADCARRCNNFRVRLYSCQEDRLFETSYYLNRVFLLYDELQKKAEPKSELIKMKERDIQRYQLLQQTLRGLPPSLPEEDSIALLIPDSVQLLESDTLLHQLIAETSLSYELSPEEQEERDSCIFYANAYIEGLEAERNALLKEAEKFGELRDEFESTYIFAEKRYEVMREEILGGGQIRVDGLLSRFPFYAKAAIISCKNKYEHVDSVFTYQELLVVIGEMAGMLLFAILLVFLVRRLVHRRSPFMDRLNANPAIWTNALYMILLLPCLWADVRIFHCPLITVNGSAFLVLICFVLTLQSSLLLRENGQRASFAIRLYVPCIAYCMLIVFLRFFFIPDPLIQILIFPASLICFVWQMVLVGRFWNKVSNVDSSIAAFSTVVFFVMTVLSACGFTYLSMVIVFWWHAQQIAIALVIILYCLMMRYMPYVDHRKKRYVEKKTHRQLQATPQHVIEVTWFVDLLRMVVLPLLALLTVPLCIYVALSFFHGGNGFVELFHQTLYSLGTPDNITFELSIYNLELSVSLYFIFRYIKHVINSIYVQVRMQKEQKRLGQEEVKTNHLNLGLGTKIIAICVWGCYIIAVCVILHLPLQSVTVVLAGMAAGLSFAMQEVLNNFFYGMQLLSGHLRVGDYLICDGFRGYVTSISYQTTQIHTETGADVSFSNKDLFSKNFQNLTKRNPYEEGIIYFDVAYGTDIALVKRIVSEEMHALNKKDKYGRPVMNLDELMIEMDELSASSIRMDVRVSVLAERMTWYKPELRLAIYNRLMAEHVAIPFNQLDVHIVEPDAAAPKA